MACGSGKCDYILIFKLIDRIWQIKWQRRYNVWCGWYGYYRCNPCWVGCQLWPDLTLEIKPGLETQLAEFAFTNLELENDLRLLHCCCWAWRIISEGSLT